jgi:hypothetical protein
LRNAREEAFERIAGSHEVRVLEPSPPTVEEAPFFADDPVARGEIPPGRRLVSPISTGDLLWEDLAREDPSLREFCAQRWLAAYRRLEPVPEAYTPTREALHRVAEEVMKSEREAANGKFGLRYTRGGFGTPFFGADVQLRVEGAELVRQEGDSVSTTPIEGVDAAAGTAIGDWFGFGASVLEELRARAGEGLEPSRVQLWPEHFDIAVELGEEEAGRRAGYGASPGDVQHPEPYLYVVPWTAEPTGGLWQAEGFTGAEMPYPELLEAPDQRAAALDFFELRLRALTEV